MEPAAGGGEQLLPPHRRLPALHGPPTEKEGCVAGGSVPSRPRRQPLTRRRNSNSHDNNTSRRPVVDPFAGRDLFPPIEEAFRISNDVDEDDGDGQHSDVSLNLSIGARAALHEHLRHVARFGIDRSFSGADDDGDGGARVTSPDPRRGGQRLRAAHRSDEGLTNPLDGEWERLNRSTSTSDGHDDDLNNNTYGDAPSGSPNSSFFVRHVLERDGSGRSLEEAEASSNQGGEAEDDDGHGEAYEVRTDLSTDYFNSSRVKLLLTPEKVRNRPGPHVTTTRGNRSHDTSSGSGSALSSSILLDEGQSVFDSDLGNGAGFEDDDDDDDNNSNHNDGGDRASSYNLLFSDAEGGGGVDVSFSAMHNDVSRISALDVSHISADGSDAGERSLLHLFPPVPSVDGTSAAVAPALPYAAALTPPRPALRAINDSRATIEDELAKVVLYSSPQRLATARRIPSPRRVPDRRNHHHHHHAFLPSSNSGEGRSIRSHGDASGSNSSHGGGSGSSNATSEDEYGIQSRGESAGYRADREYSVATSTNDGRSRIQYVALSPSSTQASPPAEDTNLMSRAARGVSDTGVPTERFCASDNERHKADTAVARASGLNAASSPGQSNICASQVQGLLSGRLTRTLSSHENVEVVVMYDLAHNSIEHDSDISSLHNQSSSYEKTNSSTSRSDSMSHGASAATERSPVGSPHQHVRARAKASSGRGAPGGSEDPDDRRRYRTVVPSRVFLGLNSSKSNPIDDNDDAMFPEPYDSFLSNPSSSSSQKRLRKEWTVRERGSHRSAPI